MNIKIAEQDRAARYGVALGLLLHAAWLGLVVFLVPKDFDPKRLRGWRGSL